MEPKDIEAAMRKLEEMDKEVERKTLSIKNLALVEHMFIGSSDYIGDELWGSAMVQDVLNQGGSENMDKITTPLNRLDNRKTIAEVNEGRVGKKLTGSIPIFEYQQSQEDKFVHPYISLDEIDQNSRISGEWRVGLVGTGNEEVDSSGLRISSDFSKYLTLEKAPDGKGQIMKLNLKK